MSTLDDIRERASDLAQLWHQASTFAQIQSADGRIRHHDAQDAWLIAEVDRLQAENARQKAVYEAVALMPPEGWREWVKEAEKEWPNEAAVFAAVADALTVLEGRP